MNKILGGYTIWARLNMLNSELFYKKPAEWFKIWFYIVNTVNYLKNDKRYTRGQRYITYEMIAETTRASFSQVKNCIKYLKDAKQIDTQKTPRGLIIIVNKYDFYQNPDNYKNNDDAKQLAKQLDKHIAKQVATQYKNKEKKEKKEIDKSIPTAVKEILAYLNEKTGKNFKETTEGTVRLIKALLNKGRTVADFKKVIDIKMADKYFQSNNKYMRPETLFNATKFDGYINEKPVEDHGEPGLAGEAYGGVDHEM